MAYQTVFQRYEMKYLLTKQQKKAILQAMQGHMALDQYGRTTIRNIYFDTQDYRLIRASIVDPIYKEKLRIRSYAQAQADSTVFVELKKKYQKVVYKRRIALEEQAAMDWVCGEGECTQDSQIRREIDYFLDYYGALTPAVFLSYEREAYFSQDDPNFRVTFDEQILCRQWELSLEAPVYGWPILPEERTLMEIKCAGGIPLWMTHALSRQKAYKTSFSKYGAAYKTMIYPRLGKEAGHYA